MTKPDEIVEAGPESVVRRRRGKWTAQQRRRIVADSRVAGANVREVAERHGVRPNLLSAWRRQDDASHAAKPVKFAAVKVSAAPTDGSIEIDLNVVPFKSVAAPAFKVLIHPDLAAFTTPSQEATQDTPSEVLDESWFSDKTLFLIRKNNFGFSVPAGCIAIAESNSFGGKDHDLVIARQKGHLLARRLFRPPHGDELALAAEAPDPRESKPTLLFTVGDVTLHRIVGMLTEQPPPPPGSGEATALPSAISLAHITTAYRVRDESGIPLALPGQIVLGGNSITKDQLDALEGALIALCLDDGSSVFKRVGRQVPNTDGRLRQFESIGGLGSSIVVSLVEPDEASEAPRFVCARRVIGVLYMT